MIGLPRREAEPLGPARGGLRYLVLALLVLATAFPSAAASPYAAGETVEVTGTVTSTDGRVLPGVEVRLTGYRKSFNLWKVRRVKKGVYTAEAVTGSDGRYRIPWRWDKFYNRFELTAGLDTRPAEKNGAPAAETAERPRFLVLAESDLSRRMLQGSPVVASPVIEDTETLESWQAFLGTLESPAQHQVYQELGKPDKVRVLDFSRHREVAWWYFERGKVYRFRGGEVESVDSFEPVPSQPPPVTGGKEADPS